jgi:hypothetical protein
MVASGLLLLPLAPLEPVSLLLPRTAAPKSFLTSGKSVGMQAPIRTQLPSMLWKRGQLVKDGEASERGKGERAKRGNGVALPGPEHDVAEGVGKVAQVDEARKGGALVDGDAAGAVASPMGQCQVPLRYAEETGMQGGD